MNIGILKNHGGYTLTVQVRDGGSNPPAAPPLLI